jgi:cyclase
MPARFTSLDSRNFPGQEARMKSNFAVSNETARNPGTTRRIAGLAILAGLTLFAGAASAQQQPRPAKLIRGGIYWFDAGGGGNSGFVVGQDGVIVVDTMTTAASGRNILAEIAKVTPKPVTTVILTHSDIDHVGGLAAFPLGLTIIAHENNKKEMEATANTSQPSPQDHLPNKTFTSSKETLTIDGVKMELFHFAPAHTSGDVQIYFPDQKVVFTGDVIATSCCGNARAPQAFTMIKAQKNGSSAGWVETVKGILKLDADIYVPGHGDLQTRAEVEERLARVEARREQVREFVAEGKSLAEIKQALEETGPPPGYDPNQFPDFTTVVYTELTKK